jgi:ribosome-associated protein
MSQSSVPTIVESDIEFSAIRSQGAGGQNVNKVSSAIHLRFDINNSSLPDYCKQGLLNLSDNRISKEGVIIIKAQQFRTQEKNRAAAIERLQELVKQVAIRPKQRRLTKATKGSQKRRMDSKTLRGRLKTLRRKVAD